jgi:hypothetical protein
MAARATPSGDPEWKPGDRIRATFDHADIALEWTGVLRRDSRGKPRTDWKLVPTALPPERNRLVAAETLAAGEITRGAGWAEGERESEADVQAEVVAAAQAAREARAAELGRQMRVDMYALMDARPPTLEHLRDTRPQSILACERERWLPAASSPSTAATAAAAAPSPAGIPSSAAEAAEAASEVASEAASEVVLSQEQEQAISRAVRARMKRLTKKTNKKRRITDEAPALPVHGVRHRHADLSGRLSMIFRRLSPDDEVNMATSSLHQQIPLRLGGPGGVALAGAASSWPEGLVLPNERYIDSGDGTGSGQTHTSARVPEWCVSGAAPPEALVQVRTTREDGVRSMCDGSPHYDLWLSPPGEARARALVGLALVNLCTLVCLHIAFPDTCS